MLNEEAQKTEESLNKSSKVCKYISILLKIIFAIFCICWMLSIGVMTFGLIDPSLANRESAMDVPLLILYLAHGVVIALLLAALVGVFSGVAKGESPFVMAQVKKLRIIAGLLLLYAIIDNVIAQNNSLIIFSGLNSGYVSPNSNQIIQINFAPFIVAGVVYAFSFVFKYGVLLQEFSDETL
ncbi:hypothetical protein [Gordonibacter urolithinfaciens]|uniref:hypothetical protein n=1 Tax=Gordonibacter urolithinfaciens TaxID=1335613 RepID=UPI003A947FC2